MEYAFYGWQNADVKSINKDFEIKDPRVLYDILSNIWCEYTCAPRLRKDWSENNKTLGQCSITAFLVQDIFGGEVYGIPQPSGGFHCFNVVDGKLFDLTSEQFDETPDYADFTLQSREKHFSDEVKRERYDYLTEAVKKAIEK